MKTDILLNIKLMPRKFLKQLYLKIFILKTRCKKNLKILAIFTVKSQKNTATKSKYLNIKPRLQHHNNLCNSSQNKHPHEGHFRTKFYCKSIKKLFKNQKYLV